MAGQPSGENDNWNAHWEDFRQANRRNPAQEYRRRLTVRLVERRDTPYRLLDIGSGDGEFLRVAARRWPRASLLGLEISETGVAEARTRVPTADFRVCDLMRAPVDHRDRQAWATHAVCSEVLEHVDDPVVLLRNASHWLAPGCRLVVTVPGGPMSAFDRHIGHRRHFSPTDLGEVMRAAGLQVKLLAGAGFPFYNVYRSLVIARGERLVADAATDGQGSPTGMVMRGAMAAFRPLLALNLPRTRYGWQTVGVAQSSSPEVGHP